MEQRDIEPILEKVSAEIADFTVGFATLKNRGGAQDVDPAGSGSLVSVDSVSGILTAAHVLANLPDHGEVGLVRFPKTQAGAAQRLTIDMGQVQTLTIGTSPFDHEGPDLGFLRLSPEQVGTLLARGNVFYNLGMRRDSVLNSNQPIPPYFDGLSGMVAEQTTDLPREHGAARVKGFFALYGVGLVVREHEANGLDLLDFEVTYGPGSESPDSYGGMSGGALWRVICNRDDVGQLSVADKKVFGVAFHQSAITDQKRIITCHGPRSVYGPLIDAIRERWSVGPNTMLK